VVVYAEFARHLVGVFGEQRRACQVGGGFVELHRVSHQPLLIAMGIPDIGDASVGDQRLVVGDLPASCTGDQWPRSRLSNRVQSSKVRDANASASSAVASSAWAANDSIEANRSSTAAASSPKSRHTGVQYRVG
jgi:hypothetical protein